MIEDLKNWAGFAALLISLGTTVYAWLTSKSRVNAEHLKGVDESMKAHDRRIQAVEQELKHLPDRDYAHRMELALEKLSGRLDTMSASIGGRLDTLDEKLQPVDAVAKRLQEYLIEEAKGAR